MISFEEAYKKVLEQYQDWGTETISLKDAVGRVLAEDIVADRDFPPFNRATKDGIAINFRSIAQGKNQFEIDGVIAAGTPAVMLQHENSCVEIMTGAVVPKNADTVIMYEHLQID